MTLQDSAGSPAVFASFELRDRADALAGELKDLKREVAKSGDDELNQRLKQVTRVLRSPGGPPFSEGAYARLKERLADELFGQADSEEQALKARKERLTAQVRSAVKAELQDERAILEIRERAVTERERQARPSYRARFAAAGAGAVLVADVLLRVVG